MSGERVVERRRLQVRDLVTVLPILSRHVDVLRDLVRAYQSSDQTEIAVAGIRVLEVVPEIVPWVASLYGMEPDAFLSLPIEEAPDYIAGVFQGDDARAFFDRLWRLMNERTGSTTR